MQGWCKLTRWWLVLGSWPLVLPPLLALDPWHRRPHFIADEHFRLVYDAKGRFMVHRISKEEATYKLCKVKRMQFGKGAIPYIGTHDGRTIRYPDPDIRVSAAVRAAWSCGRGRDMLHGVSPRTAGCASGDRSPTSEPLETTTSPQCFLHPDLSHPHPLPCCHSGERHRPAGSGDWQDPRVRAL